MEQVLKSKFNTDSSIIPDNSDRGEGIIDHADVKRKREVEGEDGGGGVKAPNQGETLLEDSLSQPPFSGPKLSTEKEPDGSSLAAVQSNEPPQGAPSLPRAYVCKTCTRVFTTPQALGGHQNVHKLERALEKRQRYGPTRFDFEYPHLSPHFNPNYFNKPAMSMPMHMPNFRPSRDILYGVPRPLVPPTQWGSPLVPPGHVRYPPWARPPGMANEQFQSGRGIFNNGPGSGEYYSQAGPSNSTIHFVDLSLRSESTRPQGSDSPNDDNDNDNEEKDPRELDLTLKL